MSKPLIFMGSSQDALRNFPMDARREAGHQLHQVEEGLEPLRWKPMATVGKGVREIRITGEDGEYRVFYVASLETAVYVLHAFGKKTEKTTPQDLSHGQRMYKAAVAHEKQRKKDRQQGAKR